MQNLKYSTEVQHLNGKSFTSQAISFKALDGYVLAGVLYTPVNTIKATIVVSSATGVPQAFYRRFSEYAAQLGYQVLTFDYRGVAKSAPRQLKGFKMSYLDWGRLDLAGAIDYSFKQDMPLFLVGHSYGGQALGLTPNHDKVSAMYCFGTGAGWHGYMPLKEKIKVQVIWNIIFPPMVAITGYYLGVNSIWVQIYLKGSTSNGVDGVKIPLTFLQILSNKICMNNMPRLKRRFMQ